MTSDKNYNNKLEICTDGYTFQGVVHFIYLDSIVVTNSDTTNEIQQRISPVNRYFCGLLKQMRSRLIPSSTKCTFYKTLIRSILTSGADTRPSPK